MNSFSTLPTNLCIKYNGNQGRGYGVWSLKDINVKTRFGPYKGRYVTSEKCQNTGFQWSVQTKTKRILILDGSEERETSWLRYVNYAESEKDQNLVALQHHSEVYFITCKPIPANTQLFVWYQNKNYEKKRDWKQGIPKHLLGSTGSSETEHLRTPIVPPPPATATITTISQLPITSTKSSSMQDMAVSSSQLPIQEISTENSLDETKGLNYVHIMGESKHETPLQLTASSRQSNVCSEKFQSASLHEVTPVNDAPSSMIKYMLINLQQQNTNFTALKLHDCNMCSRTYLNKESLQHHQRVHTEERPFQCKICNKSFKSRGNLYSHVGTHNTENKYQCDICQKYYKTAPILRMHKLLHNGERPFECNFCGRKYVFRNLLRRHMRVHTGEKPYECDVCQKKFRESSFLRNHRRVHTGERPYKCEVCGARFKRNSGLISHKRIHTGEKPYECKICQKKFRFFSPFQTHMKIHAKKKAYQCEICHKRFTKKNRDCCKQLPFKCISCGDQFLRYSEFLKHKSKHLESTN